MSAEDNQLQEFLYAIRRDDLALVINLANQNPSLPTHPALPLSFAATSASVEVVAYLLEGGALVDSGGYWRQPLESAIWRIPLDQLRERTLKSLLNFGVKKYDGSRDQDYHAKIQGLEQDCARLTKLTAEGRKIALLLLERGANPNIYKSPSGSPLAKAVATEEIEIVKILLERGANPNSDNNYGTTPLAIAVHKGSKVLVQLLIEHGADKSIADKEGVTPMEYAIKAERYEIANILKNS